MALYQEILRDLLILVRQNSDAQTTELGEKLNSSINKAFLDTLKNFEVIRKKWHHAEHELKTYKERLVNSDVAKAALEVQLKHARNQVDLEIKKRHKMEVDYQNLERRMQLVCDVLIHDTKAVSCLNDEQKSLLARFDNRATNVNQVYGKRLNVIDESSFLSHSDISYDKTDDDLLDLDTTIIRPLRSRAREKRRSSMAPSLCMAPMRRARMSNTSGEFLDRPQDKEVETTVMATVTTPDNQGPVTMVINFTQETHERERVPGIMITAERVSFRDEDSARDLVGPGASSVLGQDTAPWETVADMEETTMEMEMAEIEEAVKHNFQTKTVIRPETCVPCGKRLRFGKMALKCRDCRVVTHPECRTMCMESCTPSRPQHPPRGQQDTLESFAPLTHPRVPDLVVKCVGEIERRGLKERGLYRVPGSDRLVKELREKYLQGKGPLNLSEVDEIHNVCGLLKDFLRKTKEPLITFKLHAKLMQAAEVADEEAAASVFYQAIGDLPKVNRDTLAFLMLHLQTVMKSPLCQMDKNNLARVFGPTIVGHAMVDPTPLVILRDTNTQPKVVGRMLAFPEAYWKKLSTMRDTPTMSTGGASRSNVYFDPLTSPELGAHRNAANTGTLGGRIRKLGHAFTASGGKQRADPAKRFFPPT